ncbi:MAG: serine/threonine protein kinase [Tannerella sp.]|jgi:serine/threonine protein kinase|nr:serine/threonine protein kinase [Tannerella sp.]
MLKECTIVKERYSLLKILGKGGFSEVWLADDAWTSTRVALKFYAPGTGLDDEGIQLFTHEFALLSDLNHNNLLKPSHFDIYENMPFLVLTYCENGSTLKLINHMSEEHAWQFLRDVAEGLNYLHSNTPPIIHQDIKPDNILIDRNGRFVITDFGISARARNTLRRNVTNISTGGTLAYMPPERFGFDPSPIKASDIYSLGATMFELLTGNLPFGDHGGLLQKRGADIPVIKGDYSNRLKDIIYRCLANDTWERPTAFLISRIAQEMLNGNEYERGSESGFNRQKQEPIVAVNRPGAERPNSNSGAWGNMDTTSSANGGNNGDSDSKKLIAGLIAGLSFVVIIIVAFFIVNKLPDGLDRKKPVNNYKYEYDYYIHQGDSLDAIGRKEEPNFERMYVDALKIYLMALETAGKTGDSSLINNARGKVDYMKKLISDVYEEFLNKAEKMKEYDALEAAEAFAERADYLKDFR